MDYALDQLGFLQFEQLITELLALEGDVSAADWDGEADRLRWVRHETAIGAPLLAQPLPGPVVIGCVWVRADGIDPDERLAEAMAALRGIDSRGGAGVRSLLVVTNLERTQVEVVPSLDAPDGEAPWEVRLFDGAEVSARLDARGELRRRVPSVLGLRDLDALVDRKVEQRSTLDRAAAQQLARVFVPTAAFRRARGVLERHRFAVLTGPPEMGKTAIARMIALARMTTGWEAHECVRPDEIWTVFDPQRAQVFVADDAFGSTEYRPDLAERWARELERILQTLDDRHWLIWTSRPAPLRAALARLHRERGAERFPAPAEVLVDAGALDTSEKTLILFRHAKAAALAPDLRGELRRHGAEIVAHRHFTPERIRRLIVTLAGSNLEQRRDLTALVSAELARATEAMGTSFAALGAEHRDLLVAMLDTPPGPVSDQELGAALRRHHLGALSRSPTDLVDRMTDHFLRVLP